MFFSLLFFSFFFEWCLARLKALSLQFGRFRILRAVDDGILMPRRPFEYLPDKSSLLLFDTMRAHSCKTFFPFWYSQPAFFRTVYFIVTLPRNLRARIWPSVRISLRLFLCTYINTKAQRRNPSWDVTASLSGFQTISNKLFFQTFHFLLFQKSLPRYDCPETD